LGYLWADKGTNLEESVRLIKKALSYEPDNGYFLDSLGWAYFKQGRLEEAAAELEKAIVQVKDDAVIIDHLGDVYRALGRYEEAIESYRSSLSVEDDPKVQKKLDKLTKGAHRTKGP